MERNHHEDQCNEIEALDSIYCGELEVLETEPHKFRLPIATTEYDPEVETEGLSCKLLFTYTAKYPDTAPLVEIEEPSNFHDGYEEELLEHIHKTIEENLGIEMIFSLVSSAQEWLNVKYDELKNAAETAKEEAKRKVEEEEMKKFEGTRVTVESFMAWKLKFEQDMGITERKEKVAAEARKLTGRELFLSDNTLNESDLKFLMDAGESIESVRIDESLFQNIDDLDLDDSDDENDEDYVPE
ncbi:RWD domain-containing protein 1 [Anopheles arabiensis]|uniref:AGAP003063-PA n=6 Tax=gambiae species complex TaxID=44542 RepID=Q7QBP1_ANOGA|nr:RWD domain-containing protein 1 [Anopheles arabiensis]XP_040224827.1 RWD domain-containing protein 1 [Anopheles coluzzii]XP_312750.4 RWD domain-containing protein 1 [Anopheles gambiae]EAA08430.4 AGAP003063-PA [Anopheles gambiae str. PEST]